MTTVTLDNGWTVRKAPDWATYEVRYTPDGWPLAEFDMPGAAYRWAAARAEAKGMGPYLVYRITEHGEFFDGEADP